MLVRVILLYVMLSPVRRSVFQFLYIAVCISSKIFPIRQRNADAWEAVSLPENETEILFCEDMIQVIGSSVVQLYGYFHITG